MSTNSNLNQTTSPGGNLNNCVTLQTKSVTVNVSCKSKVVFLQTAKNSVSDFSETKKSENIFEQKCEKPFELKKLWGKKSYLLIHCLKRVHI